MSDWQRNSEALRDNVHHRPWCPGGIAEMSDFGYGDFGEVIESCGCEQLSQPGPIPGFPYMIDGEPLQ